MEMKITQKFINNDGLWVRYECGQDWNTYFQMGEMKDYIEIGEASAEALIKELSDWIAGEDSGSTQEEKEEDKIPF